MKKKSLISVALGLAIAMPGVAASFQSLDGLCGAALKQAVKKYSAEHTVVSYGEDTWEAFKTTDVRMIGGREAWWDMYSNRLVYVADGHSGMNIEHSVANSWWGGVKNDAYKDLYHLNPSDADANNRKNDCPLGIIAGIPTWTNGLSSVGTPTTATGGGASKVFMPSYEYRGDFARAYFYVFTIYDDISWVGEPAYMYDLSAYPTLKPWAVDMLLQWAKEDPVDARELARAKAVEEIQGNVNPFVLIPDLAEYVWGEKRNTPWHYSAPVYAPNRPEAPTFGDYTIAGVNSYTGRWWNELLLSLSSDAEDIYYALGDNDDYQLYQGQILIPAAQQSGETRIVKAYGVSEYNGCEYKSSISTLTLTAREEGVTDYMHAVWQRVKDAADIDASDVYIIVAAESSAVMASKVGTSGKFIQDAGSVEVKDEKVTLLPEDAAIVQLVPAGGDEYYLQISNLALESHGFLSTTAVKSMSISATGAPAKVSLLPDKSVKIDFGGTLGTLQYNTQSPRFLNYTTKQQSIRLFRCVSMSPEDGVATIADDESDVESWFDLQGRRVNIDQAPGGIYIRIRHYKAEKIVK